MAACAYDWSLETVEGGAPSVSQGDGAGGTAVLDGDAPDTTLGDDGGAADDAAGSLSQHDASLGGARDSGGGSTKAPDAMATTDDSGTKTVDAETNQDGAGGCDPGQTACGGACCPVGYPTCCISCGSYHCSSTGSCLEIECPVETVP